VSGRDVGASVRQRLLNQSRAQERPFQELLQYFAMERFLYRLSKSKFDEACGIIGLPYVSKGRRIENSERN
jgi:hypothetical protein